jgi:hypothetical protein
MYKKYIKYLKKIVLNTVGVLWILQSSVYAKLEPASQYLKPTVLLQYLYFNVGVPAEGQELPALIHAPIMQEDMLGMGWFIPVCINKKHYPWIDTRLLFFNGGGLGYRRVLDQHWLGQDWFGGIYLYFFHTPPWMKGLKEIGDWGRVWTKDIEKWEKEWLPNTVNLGFECGNALGAQLTIDFHTFFFPQFPYGKGTRRYVADIWTFATLDGKDFEFTKKDMYAASMRLCWGTPYSVYPFIGYSVSWYERVGSLKPRVRLPEEHRFNFGFQLKTFQGITVDFWGMQGDSRMKNKPFLFFIGLRANFDEIFISRKATRWKMSIFRRQSNRPLNNIMQHYLRAAPNRTTPPRYFEVGYRVGYRLLKPRDSAAVQPIRAQCIVLDYDDADPPPPYAEAAVVQLQ